MLTRSATKNCARDNELAWEVGTEDELGCTQTPTRSYLDVRWSAIELAQESDEWAVEDDVEPPLLPCEADADTGATELLEVVG